MSDLFNLQEKVAIITGGNGVLGGAMAKGLAKAGAKVAVLGRTEVTVNNRVAEIKAAGGVALGLIASVLEEASLKEANEKVVNKWGKIDILINAAGGNKAGATISPEQTIFDLSPEAFSDVNDLNLKGTVLPTMVFAKTMTQQNKGCIINISSMASQQAITRVVGYSAAKAAIDNFTKWMAVEMAIKFGAGFRVNAIAPGFFIGDQNRRLLLNTDNSLTDRGKTIVDLTPMRRFGEPDELISTTLWLCSGGSSFITGVVIPVDGGFSAFSGV